MVCSLSRKALVLTSVVASVGLSGVRVQGLGGAVREVSPITVPRTLWEKHTSCPNLNMDAPALTYS